MKKAFTMIEIIFVIVILGALAAIAVPKLIGARNDAYIIKQAANLKTLLGDLNSYYTKNGSFATNEHGLLNLHTMTNIRGDKNSNDYWYVFTSSDGKECFDVSFDYKDSKLNFHTLHSPRQKHTKSCIDLVNFLKQHENIDITNEKSISSMIK